MRELEELLTIKWRGDQSMVKHCLNSNIYIRSGDLWINCGDKKPRIERDLWYDDETDGPDDSKFEAFRAYNLRSNAQSMLSEQSEYGGVREVWLVQNYYGNDANELVAVTTKRVDDLPRSGELRKVTPEELKAINKARAEVNTDYEKRLERYWKRYNDKVMARGYWANR